MLRKILVTLGAVVGGFYLLNALVIFFFQPVSVQTGAELEPIAQFGKTEIFRVDELRSGGIAGLSIEAGGYVNMMSPERIIYTNSNLVPGNIIQNDYLYKHEFAHILQKQLVSEVSGGYPSYSNPIQSSIYYYNLIRLNNDLVELMPALNDESAGSLLAHGLESAAECYAQPHSSIDQDPVFFKAPYLTPGHCTAEQKNIAIRMFTGHWPAPLSEAQKAELVEVNITDVKPQKYFIPAPGQPPLPAHGAEILKFMLSEKK